MIDNGLNRLVNTLLNTLPNAKLASGNKEITCRCVYCGGSKTNINKRSMYISIPQSEDDVMLYNCYRASCEAKGLVTEETLLDWGIYDKECLLFISRHNKKCLGKSKNRKYKINNNIIYNIRTNYITDTKLSYIKLDYINKRLGSNFTFKDIVDKKIVLNIFDLFKANNINSFTRDERTLKLLNSKYIGFLNVDNGLLNCRTIDPNEKKRYINYKLFENSEPHRFYVMPGSVDNRQVTHIHIAEGIFDILSIYENMNKKSIPNSIFACIFGSSYYSLMRWFILDVNLRKIHFHIYADNDVSPNIIRKIIELSEIAHCKLSIYQNHYPGEKDFGVIKEKIKEVQIY